MPSLLRAGRLLSEDDLASAAIAALDASGVSRADAARQIGKSRQAVTMALDPEAYPERGHAIRRALVQEFGGYELEGPLWRLHKASGDTATN